MSGSINYISCGLLWIGLLVKLPDLMRHWSEPSLRAINGVLAFASLCFLFGAPSSVGVINRVSGVPNLAAPLTYASITAYSAALLILIVCWRGGPSVRRTTRSWMYGYAAILGGIAALFALGNAPEERRTDFDTYYATTPWIAEMVVLYLVAHLTAVTVSAVWSLRWGFEAEVRKRPWLRASLLTIGAGTVISAGYSLSKLVAVVARWAGHDWAALGTSISPLCAGLGALLTVVGVLLPMAGHHLSAWRDFFRLAPLDAVLDPVLNDRALRVERPRSPFLWGIWRQSTILNGLYAIETLFDKRLYDEAYDAELQRTGDGERATSAAWAATIAAAAKRSTQPVLEPVGASARLSHPRDPQALVLIADAVKRSEREVRATVPGPASVESA
ncbi:MAB_1171c family putative transporter [Streptomyces sp. NPDC007905]|uniref:MAB_1171c family putative transporter n=1 Tax=Streptomyces sp. NPDC007905 TaxID=3364788 RepID=UPI0036EBBCBA